MTELRRNIMGYCIVALGGLALLLLIIPANVPEYPGYGVPASVLPNIAAGFILILALVGLLRSLSDLRARKRHADKATSISLASLLRLLSFILPCALLMPAMSRLGFIPAGIAFMLVIQLCCRQRKPLVMTAVAVLPVLAVYAAMRFVLGVPMP
ncbi:MAG: tripartite tricarboxylate transporter TctB family protein [Desulfovibrio sp.]|jgi:hypothetical protein|nr:tripartite tricarboxylate transporter TctB family protein [Desulfovibrio sp.]